MLGEFPNLLILMKLLRINYREKYSTHPNHEVMMSLLRTELNHHDKATAGQVRQFFARIHTSDGVEEAEYVKDKSIDFCRKQALKEAMIKSVKLHKLT